MNDSWRWATVSDPSGVDDLPEWLRSVALDEDGTLYVPAGFADEHTVVLCASHDATAVLQSAGHFYVEADWFAREFPETAETIAAIRERLAIEDQS